MLSKILRPALRLAFLAPGAVLIGIAAGCSSDDGNLRMVSLDQRRDFQQCFSRAYLSKNQEGDADVVLVQDGFSTRHEDPRKPLTPDPEITPRQIVHIRIFWKPLSIRADHPANTNASLHWCLLGDGPGPSDVLEYSGSGLVVLDNSGNGAEVTIHKAWMKPVSQRGDMVDPIGPSMLDGSVHATNDSGEVQMLLDEMKSATAPVAQANTSGDQTQRLIINP